VTPLLGAVARALVGPVEGASPRWLREPVVVVGPPVERPVGWERAGGLAAVVDVVAEGGRRSMVVPPWPAVRGVVRGWEAPKFGVVRARLSERTRGDLELQTKFEAGAAGDEGAAFGVKAGQTLVWRRGEGGGWELVEWRHESLRLVRTARPLFEEVLDRALPDAFAREMARRSPQEEITAAALRDERLVLPKPEYVDVADMENAWQFPSVSVVDYDRDGRDDLFLTARWGRGQLLRNRGDGTFEDVTFRAGLDIEHGINAALFADFDNDGDPDVVLGRSIEPTLYLMNDGGRFHDVTESRSDLGRQFLVSSLAAADVNRDGLLDVYLSTYSPGTDVRPVWKDRYLPPDDAATLEKLQQTAHPYLDDRGAPNVLLMNRGGGRLERAGGEAVRLWRKSYQPAWADIDGDGDDDLYVCNDFAPDTVLRNDTPAGAREPVFTEAFKQFFPDGSMAFGMGASFGDHDRDGDLDLFVTNMYSKAGNRIIEMAGGADPRIEVAARGNFLYRNDGGTFTQVAAADSPEARVGWAFGGQFGDFNNDARLDLYVPSGYYTAPGEVATEVDL